MEKLINLPKWRKRPEESIELYLGEVANDTESDIIKLDRFNPNVLIAGYAGSGKTTLLQQVLIFAIKKYDPEYFNVVLYDCIDSIRFIGITKARAVKKWFVLEQSYNDLCDYLEHEIAERENNLRESGCTCIEEYNTKKDADRKPMPRMLVAIDDCNSLDNVDALVGFMRVSAHLGIHFIFNVCGNCSVLYNEEFMNMIPVRVCCRASAVVSQKVLGYDVASRFSHMFGFAYSKVGDDLTLHRFHFTFDSELRRLYEELH